MKGNLPYIFQWSSKIMYYFLELWGAFTSKELAPKYSKKSFQFLNKVFHINYVLWPFF
jgi:hypothetical protein